MTKVFPLKCEAPVDFEYQLTYLQPHQAFTVFPMSGKPFLLKVNIQNSLPICTYYQQTEPG